MAKINLAEIEARAKKATEGEWKWYSDAYETWLGSSSGGVITSKSYDDGDSTVEISDADAEFIAHAREDVPALIARLREAEVLLSKAQADEVRGHLYKEIEQYFEGGELSGD